MRPHTEVIMRKLVFSPVALVITAVLVFATGNLCSAMPNYARQSGVSCFDCHSKTVNPVGKMKPVTSDTPSAYSVPVAKGVGAGFSIHTSQTESVWSDITSLQQGGEPKLRLNSHSDEAQNSRTLKGISTQINSKSFTAGLGLVRKGLTPDSKQSQDMSVWYRLAYKPSLGRINMTVGLFGSSSSYGEGSPLGLKGPYMSFAPESYGLDAKINGRIGKVTLDLKAMYLSRNTHPAESALGNNGVDDGFSASAKVSLYDAFGLSAAYRTYKRALVQASDSGNVTSIGAWLNLADNMTLASKYTSFGSSDKEILTEDSVFSLLFITSF
ncbi:hypothetical protein MNBD_NITROSPINAE01-1298 [hydrothermal vent metagenome]|uniref:Uncharacterized protein n=1 Tax=hydrothermal vent metagenome TaxID=652676 RepID=A0A3B1C9B8_9ZZZZ